jgi:hypothetical protein
MQEQNPSQESAEPVNPPSAPPVTPITPVVPSVTPVVPPAPHIPQKADAVPSTHPVNRANEDKPKWTDKTVALFTLFLFLAAVIQGVIFYKQWQEMHSGGADTHDLAVAAKTQAEAAKAQADEAKVQVDKMAESLKKTDALIKEATAQANATNLLAAQAQRSADYSQQAINAGVEAERPWVGVGSFNVSNFVEGQTAKVSFNYVNSGKRPATASARYAVTIVKSLPIFPDYSKAPPASIAFVLPGGSFGSTYDYEVPNAAFAEWKQTKQIFFVVAEIFYTDVETNKTYITRFCSYYNPANKNEPFPLCTRYNEAK